MKLLPTIAIAIVLPILSCTVCFAELSIQLSEDNGANFSNSFTGNTGDTFDLSVFLVDDQPGGVLGTEGLGSFILNGGSSPTTFGDISGAEVAGQYEFVFANNSTATTIYWDAGTFVDPVPQGDAILLGTFSFNTTAAGTTTIGFTDDDENSDDWFTGQGGVLDALIFENAGTKNQTTITTIAVPEPGTATTFLLACSFLVRRRRPR